MAFESFKSKGFERFFNFWFIDGLLNCVAIPFALIVGTGVGFGFKYSCKGFGPDYLKNSPILGILSYMMGLVSFCMTAVGAVLINNVISGMAQSQMTLYVEN